MKSTLGSLVLALATAASSAPTTLHHQGLLRRFSSLVVFGDSYTDNGVYSYIPPVAPQSNETSTGGRVWPSYVQQYSGVNLYDYAVSGAVCDSVIANTKRSGIKQDQMSSFLTDNSYRDNRTGSRALINPPDETVYAIWIGTNDLGYGGFLTEVQPDGMPLTYFTDCVYEQLDRLHAVGARAFVLMNIAPLDLCPEYARPENGGDETGQFWSNKAGYDTNVTRSSEKMRQYFTMVNEVFEYRTPFELLLANRYPGSRFAVYDVHALMTDIWENPGNYLNGTVPYNVTSSVYQCGNACSASEVRDSYMWYDELHPSEQTDRIVAREFVNVVRGETKWARFWRS
ncbi:GDSL lipase/esterase [Aspergillus tetrazonus]